MAAESDHEHDATHAQHSDHGAHKPSNPLDPKELFGHVADSPEFHLPRFLTPAGSHGHVKIPQPFERKEPIFKAQTKSPLVNNIIQPLDLKITKFMVIEAIAAILILVFFVALGRALKGGAIPRGRFRNMLEAMLLYFRDNVARPCIGHHDADRFVPFLWTIFFFVLGCNLLGMLPWVGAPTGSFSVTFGLAMVTFATVIVAGSLRFGETDLLAPSLDGL